MSIRADVILMLSYYPVSSVLGWSETKTTEAKARCKKGKAEIDFNDENGDNVHGRHVEDGRHQAVRVHHGVCVRLEQGVEGHADGRKSQVGKLFCQFSRIVGLALLFEEYNLGGCVSVCERFCQMFFKISPR